MAQTEKEILDYWMKKDSLGLRWTQEDRIIFAMREFANQSAQEQPTISKTEKVQTAVEWFAKQVEENLGWYPVEIIQQANKMFEEQIVNAYKSWPKTISDDNGDFKLLSGEQYYTETYGNNQNK